MQRFLAPAAVTFLCSHWLHCLCFGCGHRLKGMSSGQIRCSEANPATTPVNRGTSSRPQAPCSRGTIRARVRVCRPVRTASLVSFISFLPVDSVLFLSVSYLQPKQDVGPLILLGRRLVRNPVRVLVMKPFPSQLRAETECCFPGECVGEDRLQNPPVPCTAFGS